MGKRQLRIFQRKQDVPEGVEGVWRTIRGNRVFIVTNANPSDLHGAVVDYTNHGYEDVNLLLRRGAAYHNAAYVRRTREHIALLDEAVATSPPLEAELTVYRMGRPPRGLGAGWAKRGFTFRDRGFVSTSKDEGVVRRAAGYDDIVYEIAVPRGTRVIDVNKHFASVQGREREVILPRGSRFRVTGGGYGDLRVRLLPRKR